MALARLTNGASTAVWLRPAIRAIAEACRAAAFSAVMRWYSLAEQLPCAIIMLRWKIVSQEAAVSCAIIIGSANGVKAEGFFMNTNWAQRRRGAMQIRGIAAGCVERKG